MSHAEAEELTDAQRSVLRDELVQLRDKLEGAIEGSAEEAQPVDLETPIGRLSRIDAIAQREISQAGRRQQAHQLAAVRSALNAIDSNSDEFGLCRACDEPIGFPRLRARPFSTICLRCQAAREG